MAFEDFESTAPVKPDSVDAVTHASTAICDPESTQLLQQSRDSNTTAAGLNKALWNSDGSFTFSATQQGDWLGQFGLAEGSSARNGTSQSQRRPEQSDSAARQSSDSAQGAQPVHNDHAPDQEKTNQGKTAERSDQADKPQSSTESQPSRLATAQAEAARRGVPLVVVFATEAQYHNTMYQPGDPYFNHLQRNIRDSGNNAVVVWIDPQAPGSEASRELAQRCGLGNGTPDHPAPPSVGIFNYSSDAHGIPRQRGSGTLYRDVAHSVYGNGPCAVWNPDPRLHDKPKPEPVRPRLPEPIHVPKPEALKPLPEPIHDPKPMKPERLPAPKPEPPKPALLEGIVAPKPHSHERIPAPKPEPPKPVLLEGIIAPKPPSHERILAPKPEQLQPPAQDHVLPSQPEQAKPSSYEGIAAPQPEPVGLYNFIKPKPRAK